MASPRTDHGRPARCALHGLVAVGGYGWRVQWAVADSHIHKTAHAHRSGVTDFRRCGFRRCEWVQTADGEKTRAALGVGAHCVPEPCRERRGHHRAHHRAEGVRVSGGAPKDASGWDARSRGQEGASWRGSDGSANATGRLAKSAPLQVWQWPAWRGAGGSVSDGSFYHNGRGRGRRFPRLFPGWRHNSVEVLRPTHGCSLLHAMRGWGARFQAELF